MSGNTKLKKNDLDKEPIHSVKQVPL